MAIGRTTWVSLLAQAERRSGCSLRDLSEFRFVIAFSRLGLRGAIVPG